MATQTLANRGYRSFMRPEQLECRIMLSASPIDRGVGKAPVHEVKAVASALADGTFDLSITGTEVAFSPIGTPAFMAGTIAYAAPNGTTAVGLYQETLTPIFMDVDGDSVPDFVGTTGVATFSFYAGALGQALIGTITTVNVSYIQGMTAAGELLVGSSGTITGATGLFQSMTGGFTSQSVVALYPAFAMQTAVHFVVTNVKFDAGAMGKITGEIMASLTESHAPKLKADAVDMLHGKGGNAEKLYKAEKLVPAGQSPVVSDHVQLAKSAKRGADDWSSGKLDGWASDLAACRLGVA